MRPIDGEFGNERGVRPIAAAARARRRPAKRHDEAVIRAEMRRLARALAPPRVQHQDGLRLAGDGPR